MYLANTALPKHSKLEELNQANVAKNYTLDGSLFVDIRNYRKSWRITWDWLYPADYTTIRALYDNQFAANATLSIFNVPALNINTLVYINISDREIKYSNNLIMGVSMLLEVQSPIS